MRCDSAEVGILAEVFLSIVRTNYVVWNRLPMDPVVSKLSNYAIFVLRVQSGWFEVRLKAEVLYYTTVETLYGKKRVYRVCMTKGTHTKIF